MFIPVSATFEDLKIDSMEDGGLNGEQRVLVVFDYDWSLVNENSDRYIFEVLYPELLATLRSRHGETPWTQLMDELLQELAADRPHITRAQIEAAVAQIPVQDKMLDALKLAAEHPDGMVAIVSDANTVYIESMLAHHQLSGHVTKLVTNPAHWEPLSETTYRLRVQPYHPADQQPHACANCPVNMCKGVILDELRREHPSARVLYIGDGGGDFCPATRLTKCVVMGLSACLTLRS